jgi:hypothetical protein
MRKLSGFVAIGLFAVVLAGPGGASARAVTITDANISGGHYVYDLTFAETANNTVLVAEAASVTGLTCYVDNWNAGITLHEIIGNNTNGTSAGLTYVFDFSHANYRPTAMNLRETFTLFTNIHGPDLTQAWSGWSTDGVTWTTMTNFTTPQMGYGGGTLTQYGTTFSGLPALVYYKMSMTTLPGDTDHVLTADQNQWNRIDSTNANSFLVNFTVTPVPEPITLAGFVLGGLAVLRYRKSR